MDTLKIKISHLYDKTLKISLIILNLSLFILTIIIFLRSFWQLHLSKPANPDIPKTFIIKPNQSCKQIANYMEKQNLITSSSQFIKWAIIWGMDRDLKAGKFNFIGNQSLFQIITRLSSSESFVETITIVEGLTIKEIAGTLGSLNINEEKFLSLCSDPKFIDMLGIHATSLEGYLFPDTYRFFYGESEEKIIKLMIKRFNSVLDSLKIKDSLIYKTSKIKKGLIIASIVEKESRYIPERPLIASVFWNRIKNNWRLDSDVTVHYALNDWDKALTRKDLKMSSPYNTRKYKGFPPTPICNPGKSSIQAAFFPDKTDYMFFIASGDKQGSSIFTKKLRKHNKVKHQLKKEGRL